MKTSLPSFAESQISLVPRLQLLNLQGSLQIEFIGHVLVSTPKGVA
jgi:hypothetical protein